MRFIILLICSAFHTTSLAAICYLGPAGTFTEEAAVSYFKSRQTLLPATSVAESLLMLKNKRCEFAVVPVENTLGGPVKSHLYLVENNKDLAVVGEFDLPIQQTLMGLPGAKLADIKTVLSHPQGIAQSQSWLKRHLPHAKLVEVASTAEAAKTVAQQNDATVAAIASSRAAKVYGLSILANDLQGSAKNVTRFWVVSLKKVM